MINDNYYKIRLSPEFIRGDIFTLNVSGDSVGVYSGLSEVLSGGTAGASLLSDVSIPIVLEQNTIDIGYYSVFDGYVLQKDVLNNFIYTSDTVNPMKYYVYNTSDNRTKKFFNQTNFFISWGDGSPNQSFNNFFPNQISHQYLSSSPTGYTITLSAQTPWGTSITQKTVSAPDLPPSISNPNGNNVFPPSTGNWTATPSSYDFIFHGDEICDFVIVPSPTIPFLVTGYTKSNFYEMKLYGDVLPTPGLIFTSTTGSLCEYLGVDPNTNDQIYIVNGIIYRDTPDGKTIFSVLSSGCTLLDCTIITKDETLMGVIEQPQVNSNVFIERGNNTALEYINRLGEVDNLGDMIKYGYGFFKFQEF